MSFIEGKMNKLTTITVSPAVLNLLDIDPRADPDGEGSRDSQIMDLSDADALTLIAAVTVGGAGAAGASSIHWQRVDSRGIAVGALCPLATAIVTSAAGTAEVSLLGNGASVGVVTNCTIGTNVARLRWFGKGFFRVVRDTASDATTPLINVTLQYRSNRGGR